MKDIEIRTIIQYATDYLFPPKNNWPTFYWNERVYSRWAVSEILDRISMNPDVESSVIVAEFILEMDNFSEKGSNTSKAIFVTAMDVGKDILQLL